MRKSLLTLALTASALGAVACSAQTMPSPDQNDTTAAAPMPGGPHGGRHGGHHRGARGMHGLMAADTNHDGIITREEVIAQADARFAKLDANGDGTVTSDEMQAMRQAMHDRMIADGRTPPPGTERSKPPRADRAPRSWTKAEFEARALKQFDRLDVNHDGKLDKTELANATEMRKLRHRERKDGEMPPPAAVPAPDGSQ